MSPATEWRVRVAEVAAGERDENTELHDLSGVAPCLGSVPILIIVHPGDASDEPGIDDALEAMQMTLRRHAEECRVLVLHRFSSVYMDPDHDFAVGERAACQDWFDAVAVICDRPDTIHFYGDGLGDFCDMIAPVLAQTSGILITGLWGDPEDGCAATVARNLAERGLPARLDEGSPRAHDRAGFEPD